MKNVNVLFIAARNHEKSVVLPNHFRNFKSIYLIVVTTSKIEKYLSRKEKIIVRNLKKESKN